MDSKKQVSLKYPSISRARTYGRGLHSTVTKDYDVTVITKGSDNDLTSGNKGDGFNYPTMRNLSLGISITY